ncbi:MAG: histidine phosphatase family protein [Candidatus Magasanikbacteria bacterium]|nr:histidine phosphatase family protein [Candidatus Magasanikbacteria bacterium]
MKLIIVQHAETAWNASGKLQGQHHNSPFTVKGLREIKRLAKQLRRHKIDIIYTACLSYCIRSVESVLDEQGDVPVILDLRLDQKNWGSLEGLTRAEIGQLHPDSGYDSNGKSVNLEKKYEFRPPGGGETWSEVEIRIKQFLTDIFLSHGDNETVVILTHSAIARAILASICGVHLFEADRLIAHASLNVFTIRKNQAGQIFVYNPRLMLRLKKSLYNIFRP